MSDDFRPVTAVRQLSKTDRQAKNRRDYERRKVKAAGAEKETADALIDPLVWSRKLFGFEPWGKQAEIMTAIDKRRARVAVKACHASGKTALAARSALYHLLSYPDGIVLTTAPTWPQVKRLLWGEIHMAVENMRVRLPVPVLETEIKLAANNYAVGIATNQGVRIQGYHGGHILIIIDEAPGVMPEILEAIEGIRAAGDVRILELGNPVIASGPFYDSFASGRAGWTTVTISAFDTPNLVGVTLEDIIGRDEDDPFLDEGAGDMAWNRNLTSRRWVWEKYQEWGPDHPSWQSRVLGDFPKQGENALFSLAWLEQSKLRPVTDTGHEQVQGGLDVAAGGDDETSLCLRAGNDILVMESWADPDPRGKILATLQPYLGRLACVNVDADGVGYYLAKQLADKGIPIQELHGGQMAKNPVQYANLKAEMYWDVRDLFAANKINNLYDDKAIGQLAGIRWGLTAMGKTAIESKEKAQKRGVKSPDRAESVIYAFAGPPPFKVW